MIAEVKDKQNQLAELCRRYGVRRLELFGSAAVEAEFDNDRSDLDFLVEFLPEQDLGPWLKHYFELQEDLERLFQRPVDLVMASGVRNPRFLRETNRTRQLVYAA